MKKRIICFLLALAMTVGLLPAIAGQSFAYTEGYDGMGSRVVDGGQRDFKWPVPGWYNIKSCFYDHREHYALDIAANQGTSIVASYDGTVVKAVDGGTSYYGDGFGNYVVVKHNYKTLYGTTITLYSRYNHMYSVSVTEGATVVGGQTILGKVGQTGSAEGSHLDFQICYGGWSPYKTYSKDPYANDWLELPSNLTVSDSWDCGQSYYALITAHYATPLTPPSYHLDVNGWLDGAAQSTMQQYGTFDVYVNGTSVADNVNDFYTPLTSGVSYRIVDIRPADGYSYDGIYSGNRIGTVSSDPTNVVLSFSTNDFSKITELPTKGTYNGHTYLYYSTPVTWYFAKEFCENQGGHLVCVTSSAENEFVKGLISGSRVWLGATDQDNEGTWKWVTGEQFSFSDWDSGEPNNSTEGQNGSEDYAHYNPSKWNDTVGCLTLGFVCELDQLDHEHVLQHVAAKPATCTDTGNSEYWYCSGCQKYYSDVSGNNEITQASTVIASLGHNMSSEIVPATCTQYAGVKYTCSRCEYTYTEYSEAEYSDWSTTYPSGVDESLIQSRTEYRYSDYETTTSYSISMSGWTLKSSEWKQSNSGTIHYVSSWPSGFSTSHSLYSQYNNSPKSASETAIEKTVINSTGTAGYIYWHWCRDNQQAYLESMNRLIKPVYSSEFHGFHAFYSTKTPTQLVAEGARYDSSDNSYVYRNTDCCKDTEWYFPLAVNSQSYTTYKKLFTYERWTEWSAWNTTQYSASNTRKVESRVVYRYVTSPLGEHTWDEGAITIPATCTEDGVKTFTCTACGETETETIEKLGHDYQTTVTAPTCIEQGYTTHICSHCGDAYSDTYVDATGHNIANGTCSVCGLKSPTVTVGSITAAPGETVTVPVVISNNGGFAGFTFVFTAEGPLSITKIAKGDLLQTADSGSFTTNVSGGIVTWFDSVNTVGDGTLMLLTVAVDGDAQDGEYYIQAFLKDNNETNFVDEGSQAIPVTFGAGTISVESAPVEAKLTISGNPVTAAPGSTITVPVMISGGESFAGFTFTISASEELTLKSIEKGALLEDADGMFTKNIAQRTVNWTCSENLIGDGELMLLTFDVSETANEGDLTISISLKDNKLTNMVDADEEPVSTRFEDIHVTVSSVIYGDTNGDGEVDTADAVRLVRYLVDLVELTEPQRLAADVNHDNDLTSADSIRLVRYLVGLVDTLDTTAAEQPARARTAKQATTGATIEIGTVSGEPGATVTVPVTISGNTGFAGFTLEVSYPEYLTLTKVTKGSLLKESDSGALTSNLAKNLINWNDVENLSGDGQLFVLTFKIDDSAASGDYAVSIAPKDGKPGNFVDEEGNPVSLAFHPGTVTVSAHEHKYIDVVTSPTCTEKGYTTHTCSICGDSYVDTYVDALGHDWGEWTLTTPPTATENGVETRTCNRCGETETCDVDPITPTVTVGNAIGQNGDTVTIPVTITGNTGFAGFTLEIEYPEGLQLTKVTKGTLLKDSDGGALTSNLTKNLINWNDVENLTGDGQLFILSFKITASAVAGNYSVSIKLKDGKSGNFVDEEGNPVPATFEPGLITVQAHKHQYVDVVTPPTCTEQGYTTHTCSICGDSYVDTYVDALGHDWSEWTTATAPTCTAAGAETRTCSRCNESENRVIAALGHDLIPYKAKTPTCTEIGWNAYDICSRCDYTTYEELSALGHAPGQAKKENNVEPTCTASGGYDMVVRCTRCNGILESTHTDVPALGHTWSDWAVTTEPTCTEKGVETRICSRCNEDETREVAALGHDLISHEAKTPTCTEIGWSAYDTCSRCDYTTYEEIPALGHDWSDWTVTTVPTCTEKGAETRACSRCNEDETREVDALGHDLISHEAKAPTCTEIGWNAYDTCSRCDYTTYEEIPALGHEWGSWAVTTAPTCTEKGTETRVCTRCNEDETRELTALGHDLIPHEAKAPTCTEIGWNAYDTCSRCDYTTYEEIPALGHEWGSWAVTTAPTCTEKGAETRVCSRCNEDETREVAALGHDLIPHEAKAPTCTEIGWNAYDTCSRCDYTTYEEIPALGHDWSDWTVTTAPTCTEKGAEKRACSRCSENETREVAALGHDLISHEAKAPTCTEIGWDAYDTCSRCDYTTYEELPALGHNPGQAKRENNVEPTCTASGEYDMVVRCTRCNGILESTHTDVPALGHNWSDWTVTTAPTCTEKGAEARTCSRCRESETREVAALGHDLIHHEAKAPTCAEVGWSAYDTCSRCDYTTYEEIPALGHEWGSWAVTTAPTCTEKGIEARTCSRCNETETREVAALGHIPSEAVKENNVEPTCTSTGGYDMVTYCSVCGAELSRVHTDVAALDHDWDDGVVQNSPTCTDEGVTLLTCKRCGETKTEVMPATGHTSGEPAKENEVEATCTTVGGYDLVVRCTACNAIVSSKHTEVPALGHDYVAVVTEPTCTEKGFTTYTCSRCGASYTANETDALGHNWSDWTIATDPAFAGKNVEIRTCTRCNMTETRELDLECYFVNFSDCRDSWYHEAVDFVVYKGLMGGVGHNKFDPNGTMTRAMMVTVLYRMVGSPAVDGPSTFSDVPTGQWYSDAISWAQSNGIVGGIGHNLFAPEAPVTREDLATILWRSQGSPATSADLSGFRDSGTIDSYAYGAMQWAVAVGILNGDAGRLKPVDSATRAEFACIIMRYLKGSYICTER